MSNEKQRNRPASRQLQDKVGGVAPASLSPDGNETWRWLPFWCSRWEWLSAALLKLIRQYARSMERCAQTASRLQDVSKGERLGKRNACWCRLVKGNRARPMWWCWATRRVGLENPPLRCT